MGVRSVDKEIIRLESQQRIGILVLTIHNLKELILPQQQQQ